MRLVIQRVKRASCTIDNEIYSKIDQGFMILVGITSTDNKEIVEKMCNKALDLRIFDDENGKMNRSITDVGGKVLSISQFTLYADCRKGRRPGFEKAAKPDLASPLYDYFNECVKKRDIECLTGIFGAEMQIDLLNDGPITIILDSDEIC